MPIVGILLAAGRGTRFGGDKLLAPLRESSLGLPAGTAMGVAAAIHVAAALPDSIAVVRPGDARVADGMRATGLRIVECANAGDGMGASLACGVISTCDADGWIVALADMPWIAPATIRAVAGALARGADIVAPVYRGTRGHPVGFSRRYFAALCALTGDAGARSVLLAHPDELTLLDVDDAGVLADVDSASDLRMGVNGDKRRGV
jgi:molybdenum cofactor cytidylyltransferase